MLKWLKRKKTDPLIELRSLLGELTLPNFPKIVLEALSLLRDPNAPLEQVGERIALDPAVSATLLSLANSAAFALRHPVRHVQHAAALLGRSQLESILLSFAVSRSLPRPRHTAYDHQRFWRAATQRATFARLLADKVAPSHQAECFTAALLCDMAIPLILQNRASVYGPIVQAWHDGENELSSLEEEHFGWNHAYVSELMCEAWNFPPGLSKSIGAHHDAEDLSSAQLCVVLAGHLREVNETTERLARRGDELGVRADDIRYILETSQSSTETLASLFTS